MTLADGEIDQVKIITYDTQRAAWAAMMRGDIDMVQEVNREVVEFLEGSNRFEMYWNSAIISWLKAGCPPPPIVLANCMPSTLV